MRRALGLNLFATLLTVALVASACGGGASDDAVGVDDAARVDAGTTTGASDKDTVDGGAAEVSTGGAAEVSTTDESTAGDEAAPDEGQTSVADDGPADDVVELTQGRDMHIITIAGPLLDPFFSAWEKGTVAAGDDLGVKSDYTAPADFSNVENDLIRLMEAAISQKPDGIIVGNFLPDVQGPGIQDAIDAGIPVVIANSGEEPGMALGAIAFVGAAAFLTGERTGEEMIANGVTSGLCMDHVPQNPATTEACQGMEAAFEQAGLQSSTFNLPLTDSANPQAIASALRGQLSADPDIDGVFTLGTAIAESAMQTVADLGVEDSVGIVAGNLSTNVMNAIADGDLLFAIDQQPYLQGYYGVLIAVQFAEYGLVPTEPVRTGPAFVTKDNVERAIRAQEQAGVRGSG